jgi:hypothetical protein
LTTVAYDVIDPDTGGAATFERLVDAGTTRRSLDHYAD